MGPDDKDMRRPCAMGSSLPMPTPSVVYNYTKRWDNARKSLYY